MLLVLYQCLGTREGQKRNCLYIWSFVLMRQAGKMRMECIFAAAEIPFYT